MQNKFETINHFYLELINRFFHPKSYFYFCITNFLDNKTSDLETIDDHSFRVISNFIKYLVESPQPALELKEITQIQSFKTFYSELEDHLLQLNLKKLDPSQLKVAIKNYAHYFMSKLVQRIAKEPNGRATLEKYLNIKTNLRSMLKTSGAKSLKDVPLPQSHLKVYRSKNTNGSDSKTVISEKANRQFKPVQKNNALFNNNILQGFFEEEIFELLKPLAKISSQSSNFFTSSSDLNKCFESFLNIKEVSLYHGYEEIEAIADRVVKIVIKFKDVNQLPDQSATSLILEAKTAIEKFVFHHQNFENIQDLLQKYDRYISSDGKVAPVVPPLFEPEMETLDTEPEILPTPSANQEKSAPLEIEKQGNEKNVAPPTPIVSENDDNIDKDLLEFKLPGEDDEELLNLLQEITPQATGKINNGAAEKLSENSSREFEEGNITSSAEQSAEEIKQNKKEEKSENHIDSFHEEADLYHKVILNAVTQLMQNKKYQVSLEDIELASASLNQLAQKFGLEKIAFLPEIMESISFQANKRSMKLPKTILENMEKGIILLKIFDRYNTDHKIQFISILTALKEYYINTFGMQGIKPSSGI